jgi:hypothetical protein
MRRTKPLENLDKLVRQLRQGVRSGVGERPDSRMEKDRANFGTYKRRCFRRGHLAPCVCVKHFDYRFKHLSAGDLLREEQDRPGSEFGDMIKAYTDEGTIVPIEATIQLLENARRTLQQQSILQNILAPRPAQTPDARPPQQPRFNAMSPDNAAAGPVRTSSARLWASEDGYGQGEQDVPHRRYVSLRVYECFQPLTQPQASRESSTRQVDLPDGNFLRYLP